MPNSGLTATRTKHQFPNIEDQAAFFCNRNKVYWGYHSQFGMTPSYQRLKADDLPAVHINLWLIMRFELLLFKGLVKIALETKAHKRSGVHVSRIELVII